MSRMSAILAQLDEISVAIARLSGAQPSAPVQGPPIAQRELLRKNLKERGIPSSTIRQIDITRDEMEKSR